MEDPANAQSRNITIGVLIGVAVLLLGVVPCLAAALVAFAVAFYRTSEVPSPSPPAPPRVEVEPAPRSSSPQEKP